MEVFENVKRKPGIYRMVWKKVGESFEPTSGEDVRKGDVVYLREFKDGELVEEGEFRASVDSYLDENGLYQFDLVKEGANEEY